MSLANGVVAPTPAAQGTLENPIMIMTPSVEEDMILLGKVGPPPSLTVEEGDEPKEQTDPPVAVPFEKEEEDVTENKKQSVIVLTEEVVAPAIDECVEEEKKEEDPETFETSATIAPITPPAALGSAISSIFKEHAPGVVADEELGLVAMFQEIHQSLPEAPGKEMARAAVANIFTAPAASKSAITNLFNEHVPGVVADKEVGLVAMFQEIHQSMPETPGKEQARAAVAHIFAAWADMQKKTIEAAKSSMDSPRSSTAVPIVKDDISMAAMFKEVGDAMPSVQRDAVETMDAILAKMLLAVSHVPELVSPTVTETSIGASKNEDISLTGMFKEIASLLPGGNVTEKQVETHMVGRVEQIMTTN